MMLREKLIHFVAAGVAALALVALPAQAQERVSNLGESTNDSYDVDFTGPEAQAFTTDSGTYNLTSVTINISGVTNAGGNFTLRIFSDSGGLPGSVVSGGVLSGPGNPVVGQNVYTAAGTLTLAPNTQYWVVAQVSSGAGSYDWSTTASFNQTGSWTILDNEAYSEDAGATWDSDVDVLQMSVSATPAGAPAAAAPVPTLDQWALVMLSILIVTVAFVRRNAKG
jgi:hypothetical protein